jgi:hypothetical protein
LVFFLKKKEKNIQAGEFQKTHMENQSVPQHSLAELAKKPLNGLKEQQQQQQQQQQKRASNNSDATAEALESNIQKLLEVCLTYKSFLFFPYIYNIHLSY